MKRTERWVGDADRYQLDFGACSAKKGFAQVDTDQDAWYFGNWANPETLVFVTYAEGDLTIIKCETPDEFTEYVRKFKEWQSEHEHFKGIDPMGSDRIKKGFESLGLGDLLH